MSGLSIGGAYAGTCDIPRARRSVGERVALQGNMDPAVLNAGADAVRRAVRKVLDAYGSGSGHVFNLGHGIPPTAKIENVAAMIETIHNYC